MSLQTRSIVDFLDAAPDVDVRATWEAYWATLTAMRDRLLARFPGAQRHPSCADHESYEAGTFEGSLTTWTGGGVDWMVHSWIGNRTGSILDMNITVWLDQAVDVPHLAIVFGTVPQVFHYSDFLARRDLALCPDYLNRWYEPENRHFLEFRGDERFTPAVSHGLHTRAVLSPVGHSYSAERTDEVVDAVQAYALARFERWLAMVDAAEPVPEAERATLRARDRRLRVLTYTLDPMNALATRAMGAETAGRLVALRYGKAQLDESATAADVASAADEIENTETEEDAG